MEYIAENYSNAAYYLDIKLHSLNVFSYQILMTEIKRGQIMIKHMNCLKVLVDLYFWGYGFSMQIIIRNSAHVVYWLISAGSSEKRRLFLKATPYFSKYLFSSLIFNLCSMWFDIYSGCYPFVRFANHIFVHQLSGF